MEPLEIEPNPNRRKPSSKTKKKPTPEQKLAIINQKLAFLAQNLKPFPFVPNTQTLTLISTHEPLFRSLDLWDFANVHLDSQIKIHLLAELIAHHDPSNNCSFVRGLHIYVTRTYLTRALKLPLKSQRSGISEFDANKFGGGDVIEAAIRGFILNKMVFLDDAGIIPEEAVNAMELVKKGLPNTVDWAQLMWDLVRKELKKLSQVVAPTDGKCYHVSHLQRLMKCQKPMLFEEAEGDLQIPEEDGGSEQVEDVGPGGAFLFENEHKRASDEIDDHSNVFNQHHQQKRFQSDYPWEHTPTISGFNELSVQLQHLMGKARMDLIEKEQVCLNAREQMRCLNEVLQQKDEIIQSLEKDLKETQIAFADYRNKFPICNKLSCKEGNESARDVLDGELTKPCLAEDEETLRVALSMTKGFGNKWFEKLNKHATWISMSAKKLVKIRDEHG